MTKYRTFFKPCSQTPFSCRFLGNMGMEDLWGVLKQKRAAKERISRVSHEGHGAEIEIETAPKEPAD
jgi:hypothetical protein